MTGDAATYSGSVETIDRDLLPIAHADSREDGFHIVYSKEPVSLGRRIDVYSGNQITSRKMVATTVNDKGKIEPVVVRQVEYEYSLELLGERFRIEHVEEGYFLRHPEWPLMGEGADIDAAKQDLIATIREVRAELIKTETSALDASAFAFREFLTGLNV
ncbi:MAG: hypothetical protein AB1428_12915 [Bacteroidota bacterium]